MNLLPDAPWKEGRELGEAPKGELDSPLEVPRLCEKLEQEIYETGHLTGS